MESARFLVGLAASSMRVGLATVGVGVVLLNAILTAASGATIQYEQIRATKRVTAVRTDEPIKIDGVLSEAAWKQARPAIDFYQQSPDEGKPATMASEVRFLYDDNNLMVGGTFFDTDPLHGPITNELKRDFSPRDGDFITLVFDTFHDLRNSTNFMVNPDGALRDSQAYDDGRQNNANWDGVWFVKTARFETGWTMEVAIPFKTFRFKPGEKQEWGLQIMRLVRRTNEVTMWSPVPRQFGQFKTSYAGVLEGMTGITPGHSFRIKPFATTQMSSGVLTGTAGLRRKSDGGVEIKYGVGTSLTLDASYRTDFSQVEVDQQQVNLTRFNLFFPEKREFFLENQGAFRIGDQDSSGQTTTSQRRDLLPFFSRRIGLSSAGEAIPLVGGVRLTGKQGPYSIGLLEMRTERSADAVPASTYTAVRLSRDVGPGSSVGAFYLGTERANDFNRVFGADVHLNFRRANDFDAFVLQTHSPGPSGSAWAGRAAVSAKQDRYTAQASYTNIPASFRNDLGFVPRLDVGITTAEYQRYFRPQRTYRWIRAYTAGGETSFSFNSGHDELLTRTLRHNYGLEFANGGIFTSDFLWNREMLLKPFAVATGVVLPPGVYHYQQFVPSYASNKSKWLSGSVKLTLGEFWSGHLKGIDSSVRVRLDEHLAVSATYTRNHVTLPEGAFEATIAGFRVDYSFSTRMFLNAFIQHNSATKSWLSNVRFDLIHRPLSDLFIVYNDGRGPLREPARALTIKYTHLLLF